MKAVNFDLYLIAFAPNTIPDECYLNVKCKTTMCLEGSTGKYSS